MVAFTVIDFCALCAGLVLCAIVVLPAIGRTHNNNSIARCMNNLRQLGNAWSMYSPDNAGFLVHSYPHYSSNLTTWCDGSAQSGGDKGSYTYYGSDPMGIEVGGIWPYIKSIAPYKCPDDKRVAYAATIPVKFRNQPILRSYSMNCYLAGQVGTVTILNPTGYEYLAHRFFIKQSEIVQPSRIFTLTEPSSSSIGSGMFLVSVESPPGSGPFPIEGIHQSSYAMGFADTHVESFRRLDRDIVFPPTATLDDWSVLSNHVTVPNP